MNINIKYRNELGLQIGFGYELKKYIFVQFIYFLAVFLGFMWNYFLVYLSLKNFMNLVILDLFDKNISDIYWIY